MEDSWIIGNKQLSRRLLLSADWVERFAHHTRPLTQEEKKARQQLSVKAAHHLKKQVKRLNRNQKFLNVAPQLLSWFNQHPLIKKKNQPQWVSPKSSSLLARFQHLQYLDQNYLTMLKEQKWIDEEIFARLRLTIDSVNQNNIVSDAHHSTIELNPQFQKESQSQFKIHFKDLDPQQSMLFHFYILTHEVGHAIYQHRRPHFQTIPPPSSSLYCGQEPVWNPLDKTGFKLALEEATVDVFSVLTMINLLGGPQTSASQALVSTVKDFRHHDINKAEKSWSYLLEDQAIQKGDPERIDSAEKYLMHNPYIGCMPFLEHCLAHPELWEALPPEKLFDVLADQAQKFWFDYIERKQVPVYVDKQIQKQTIAQNQCHKLKAAPLLASQEVYQALTYWLLGQKPLKDFIARPNQDSSTHTSTDHPILNLLSRHRFELEQAATQARKKLAPMGFQKEHFVTSNQSALYAFSFRDQYVLKELALHLQSSAPFQKSLQELQKYYDATFELRTQNVSNQTKVHQTDSNMNLTSNLSSKIQDRRQKRDSSSSAPPLNKLKT